MRKIVHDPLLAAARILLILLIGICGIGSLALILGLPALLIFQGDAVAQLAEKGVTDGQRLIPALAMMLAGFALLLSLAIYFLLQLYRIVASVAGGNPFVSENAERLGRMGWAAFTAQVFAIPFAAVFSWLATNLEGKIEEIRFDGEVGISATGILLVLVLFILARVFRLGAAMRQDLEGTV